VRRSVTSPRSTSWTSPTWTASAGSGDPGLGGDRPEARRLGGLYLEDCEVAEPNNTEEKGWGVRDYAVNPVSAERLWELSAQLTG